MTDLAFPSGRSPSSRAAAAPRRRAAVSAGASLAAAPIEECVDSSARYGEGGGRRWPALLVILLAHALVLVLLVRLDVISVQRRRPLVTMVELVPLPVEPPPAAPAPPAHPAQAKPIAAPRIVAPPPIVPLPVAPSPVAAAPVAVPPAPVVSAEVPAAPAATGPAEAVTAPDGMARSLGNPSPRYPYEARRRHQEGTVRLRVVITPEGRVREIAVARSSGVDLLDEAALTTVRHWRFLPGRQAGAAVEAVGYLSIPFRLT